MDSKAIFGGLAVGLGAGMIKQDELRRKEAIEAARLVAQEREQTRDLTHRAAEAGERREFDSKQATDERSFRATMDKQQREFTAAENDKNRGLDARLALERREDEHLRYAMDSEAGALQDAARRDEPWDVIPDDQGGAQMITRGGQTRGLGFRPSPAASGVYLGSSGGAGGTISTTNLTTDQARTWDRIVSKHTSYPDPGMPFSKKIENWKAIEKEVRDSHPEIAAVMFRRAAIPGAARGTGSEPVIASQDEYDALDSGTVHREEKDGPLFIKP